jgi:hypothetical protein
MADSVAFCMETTTRRDDIFYSVVAETPVCRANVAHFFLNFILLSSVLHEQFIS